MLTCMHASTKDDKTIKTAKRRKVFTKAPVEKKTCLNYSGNFGSITVVQLTMRKQLNKALFTDLTTSTQKHCPCTGNQHFVEYHCGRRTFEKSSPSLPSTQYIQHIAIFNQNSLIPFHNSLVIPNKELLRNLNAHGLIEMQAVYIIYFY